MGEKISLWIKFNVGWPYKPYQNPTVWACHMHLRELSSRVLRKLRPQTLKNSDPPGCLEHKDLPKTSDPRKTQIPGCLENSDPQYFSNIATNYRPRAASLSFPSTEAKFRFPEISPERKFALAKFPQNQIFLTVCNETLCSDRYVWRSVQIKRSNILVIVKPILVKKLPKK